MSLCRHCPVTVCLRFDSEQGRGTVSRGILTSIYFLLSSIMIDYLRKIWYNLNVSIRVSHQ